MALVQVDIKVFPSTMAMMDLLRASEIIGLKNGKSITVNGLTLVRKSSRMWTMSGDKDQVLAAMKVLRKTRSVLNEPTPVAKTGSV